MKVTKRFRWEAAHRLPWHEAECKFVHGHSYRMMVEVEGEPTENTPGGTSMLIDFKHVKRLVKPLVEAMDHATLVATSDSELKEAMEALGTKTYEMPSDTTAENLATHVADRVRDEGRDVLLRHGVDTIRVQVWETETCYAEVERHVGEIGDTDVGEEVKTEPEAVSA
jgi:6-pyruvoyltetrahydropterin/6-carboxytetrahydropterin synthase